jgi:ubiquinone/menaquinone biosynthesis C-methylase UbiE
VVSLLIEWSLYKLRCRTVLSAGVPRLGRLRHGAAGQNTGVERAEAMVARWDSEADRYDDEPDHGLNDPLTRQAWRRVLGEVLPSPPADVLDVACGTGSLAVLLAEDGHRVTGIDVSPAMLTIARRKALDAGVHLTLRRGDVTLNPVGLRPFDVVLARYVLWLLPDPAAAVRDWLEIAGPRGQLVLIEDRFWPRPRGSRSDLLDVVRPLVDEMTEKVLDHPDLWGDTGANDDDVVMLVCRPSNHRSD